MNDGMNAFFIDTHTKSIGTYHHVQLIIFELLKYAFFLNIA